MSTRPSAQGTLESKPLAHLLIYVQSRQLTGTLAIWPDRNSALKGQDRLLIRKGAITAIRPLAEADSALSAVLGLFDRKGAPYQFYEGQNLLGGSQGVLQDTLDIYTVVSHGLRRSLPDRSVDDVLSRIGHRRLQLRDGAPLARLELDANEQRLLETMRNTPSTLLDLSRTGLVAEPDVRRLVYLLTLIRGLVVADSGPKATLPGVTIESMRVPAGQRASTAPGVPSPTRFPTRHTLPPPSLSPPPSEAAARLPAPPIPRGLAHADEARWRELAGLFDRLDELTHYALLGLASDASSQEISTAYFSMVKKFHPDRLPTALAPLARCAQVLFEQLTEANETLGSAEQRAAYDEAVTAGGGTRASERMMRNVLESVVDYQKAEVLVKRREYAKAMPLLQSALNKNPGESDYLALYAWVLHLQNPTEPAPIDEMLRILERALNENPRSERAHYYRGVILKRAKRDQEALRHFRAAAEINPHNVDAARELRIANMRRDSKAPPEKPPGRILSRWFGSK